MRPLPGAGDNAETREGTLRDGSHKDGSWPEASHQADTLRESCVSVVGVKDVAFWFWDKNGTQEC